MKTIRCYKCKKVIDVPIGSLTTGYGINDKGQKICFECCGEQDKQQLRDTGKFQGYFTGEYFTNWPGTLKLKIFNSVSSWHNFAGKGGRVDFWLKFEENWYHGIFVGFNHQCATIRRVKKLW